MTPTPLFRFWCQKVLPLVYDDSLSNLEVLHKVVDYLNNVITDMNQTLVQVGKNTEDIATLRDEVDFVMEELDKVKHGDYVSLYLDSIIAWIDQNIQELVARIVKYVFFGLSTDGHFIATIPDSWEFIEFDTIMLPESPLWGHLVLRW